MNVLLVSQCSKNALVETRRILDQFAERRGDRTWQTPITMEGLATLRKLLRKTARKNTAVACHWIRGRDHSELMWIVGDARRFNPQGAVPTNTTSRDILRGGDENDWHTGENILLLAELAALLHDLGKACQAFQQRLEGKLEGRNLYRHEWISLRLFAAFVGNDEDVGWLERLASSESVQDADWLDRLVRDGLDGAPESPFRHLPPLAAAIGWLVVTHHRLPMIPGERREGGDRQARPVVQAEQLRDLPGLVTADWNEVAESQDAARLTPYWTFEHSLPVTTAKWAERARHIARRLLARQARRSESWLDNPYVMHLARLALMLADHHYSSLEEPAKRVRGEPGYPLYANTVRKTGRFNQPLDEHLLGVAKHSAAICRSLPSLMRHLPRLARHKGFRQRSENKQFRWQDCVFDLAQSLRERSERQGFFGINMASTGCGKTLANGRILYALADPQQGARFSVALGLRTLTLQTGQAYRERLRLGEDELAIRVGGSASRALFEHHEREAERTGSASVQELIEEDGHVLYEGNFEEHPVLRRLGDPASRALVAAPILVCTVDHLVPATEGTRGGRQIAPMLRLMGSDLVLDEVDDFDIQDLPALTRLVHWAGLLGSRVLLSSATLPPALVRGLYEAYRDGRAQYQRNRGEPGRPLDICCAWFDEHDRQHADCPDGKAFAEAHRRFAIRRHGQLAKAPVRRRAELVALEGMGRRREEIRQALAERLRDHAATLHARHHSIDPHSGKRVSFGLIRLANIEPIVDVAQALFRLGATEGQCVHLCVYHSQYPLLMRSAIERRLDRALDRRSAEAVFGLSDIRRRLDASAEEDQLFIVLGSPVTEVGRDHDYDWAIVEPSSMRSLIQLAGRVWRHRDGKCDMPNLMVLDTNLSYLENPDRPAFCRPGFEGEGWPLDSHLLNELLRPEEWEVIDARPRILEREALQPRTSLVDLEHARLARDMVAPPAEPVPEAPADLDKLTPRQRRRLKCGPPAPPLGAYTWYVMPRVNLVGVMAQCQPFRRQTIPQVELVLLPDESGEAWELHQIRDGKRRGERLYVRIEDSLLRRIDPLGAAGPRIRPWGDTDYLDALVELADEMELPLENAAKRFGTVTLPESTQGWCFHPVVGFSKRR
ncbi:type I-F CRISPR-associated helicase Cas3f [Halomonas salifodinae]|uniref:Type I-F CRISPR-associated helicase Cas3f n=1 Tax=Halomonas salifodinae TaxID=438745 RepID=A0ABW2ETQ1_9GAMM